MYPPEAMNATEKCSQCIIMSNMLWQVLGMITHLLSPAVISYVCQVAQHPHHQVPCHNNPSSVQRSCRLCLKVVHITCNQNGTLTRRQFNVIRTRHVTASKYSLKSPRCSGIAPCFPCLMSVWRTYNPSKNNRHSREEA